MTIQPTGGVVERGQESTLADVVTTVLDKSVVIDVFARVSLVSIELLRATTLRSHTVAPTAITC
jgi:gas vesicle structural protein